MGDLMIETIRVLLIFAFGSSLGWMIEFFYRGAKVNPGFLAGPYLPIYGVGAVILNYISGLTVPISLKIVLFAFSTTSLELMTGLIFIGHYRIRLWDYRKNLFNFRGIISPLYTFYWTLLSLVFYLLVYPFISNIVELFYQNLELSFFVGIFYGVLILDLSMSFKLASRIKGFVLSRKAWAIVNMESLKVRLDDRLRNQGHMNRLYRFFSSPNRMLNNELFDQLNSFINKKKRS